MAPRATGLAGSASLTRHQAGGGSPRTLRAGMAIEDLLVLQGKCKTDPESYRDEFLLRLRHFNSLLVRRMLLCEAAPTATQDGHPLCACTLVMVLVAPSAVALGLSSRC